jgi:hypothetical protein
MSTGFLLILASIFELVRAEVAILAATSAVVQCLWKPKRKPVIVQVAFSAAALVISAAFTQTASETLTTTWGGSAVSRVVLAAFLLYSTNTVLVAAVVSLVEARPFRTIWRQCHLWAFPYFLCGAVLLDVAAAFNAAVTWREALLLLPLMILLTVNYRILTDRIAGRHRVGVEASIDTN